MSLFASGRIAENRYYDWNDCVHHIFGQTGGAQGDPLEMIAFCMTTLHIWGRIMGQHLEERAVAYTDDGYFVGRLISLWQSSSICDFLSWFIIVPLS